jgi:hypothetical protein
VSGGDKGRPLNARNARAPIGLASGDQSFSDTRVALLEHAEELSRTRACLARSKGGGESLMKLAPRLRRRATLVVRQVPPGLRRRLEQDTALVRTGVSAAAAYGWPELDPESKSESEKTTWALDAYVPLAIVAYRQLIARSGIEFIRGSASDRRSTPCCSAA